MTHLQTILETIDNQAAARETGCLSMQSERLLASEIGRLNREALDAHYIMTAQQGEIERLRAAMKEAAGVDDPMSYPTSGAMRKILFEALAYGPSQEVKT